MNGYDLSRMWFDFCFENPERISPIHTALYFFAIEHCNRMGWKEKFGFPTEMAKDAIGVKSYNTYIKALNDLVEWGFIKMVQKSKNQYSANIIALSKNNKAPNKALDKAITKHVIKQSESTGESIDSIDKPLTIEPYNHKPKNNTPNGVTNFGKLGDDDEYSKVEKTKTGIYNYLKSKPNKIQPYVDFWNLFAEEMNLAKVKTVSSSRKRKLKVRIKEDSFNFSEILRKAKVSEFLLTGRWFGFDWIIENESNYVKVLEGNYDKTELKTTTDDQPPTDSRILEKLKAKPAG